MAATQRVILMIEPAEKLGWASRARAAGVSTAEFIRRAVAAYDPDMTVSERDELSALAAEVRGSAERMAATLDVALADLRAMNDPGREARLRAKVAEELRTMPRLDLATLGSLAA